jgi:alanine racemase
VAKALRERGRDCGLLHACDSIGMVRHPQWRFDAVRIGAWLYGVVPSRYPNANGECRMPVRFKTRVVQVRNVAKGEYLGYDETHPLDRDRVIATLSAGYADGYPRVNSTGEVCVRGRRAPIAGLLCMDQMTVDVTGIPGVCPGDEVTLLGEGITLEQYSAWTGAHRNEALTRIGRRVPRVYIRGGEAIAAE